MKLYILNELIEPDGEHPEVVNYVFKSKEEVAAAMASAMTSAAYAEPPSAVGSYLV